MPIPPSTSRSELEHVQARLDHAQRIAALGDWETDAVHAEVHWSKEVYRILGLRREETRPEAEAFYRGVHPEDVAFVRETKRAIAAGSPVMAFEHRIVRPDGEIRHVQQRAERVVDAAGAVVGMIGTIQDLTERKREEAALFRAQRVNSIGTLASGIAHDLNNALTPIVMAAELLRAGCTAPSDRHLLEMVRIGAERSASMVRQILTFARGAEGDHGPIEVPELVQELVDISRHTFPKTVEIRARIDPAIWPLHGDRTQLQQVLLNLCVNARDAMPDGGVLTLSAINTQLDQPATIATLPATAMPGRYVVLAARDTGTGMSDEVRARIFEPFFTTKPPDRGTGIGLSIVRSIVKGHGGFVTVESKLGVGTEFQVWLPVTHLALHPAAIVAQRPAVPLGANEMILVVDDEAAIRSMATGTLELSGYTVLTAANGAEAILQCRQHRGVLRLMITDLDMPVVDGSTAIRAVAEFSPEVRIIVASGTDSASRAQAGDLAGKHAVLPKPYSADQLLQAVHDALRR